MKGEPQMGFWDGERCEFCNGHIMEKVVDVPRKAGRKYFLLRNVPAGVCKECGTRYYAANVLKTIKSIVQGRKKAVRQVTMPVYSF